jgi:hypothetical protein
MLLLQGASNDDEVILESLATIHLARALDTYLFLKRIA